MSMPRGVESLNGAENLYENAPLVEVVCEFRFLPGESWDVTFFGLLYEKVKSTYEIREKVTQIQSESSPGLPGTVSMQFVAQETLRISRPDRTSFIDVSPNMLSVHHVPPYPGWAGFLHLVKFALGAYRDIAKPQGLARVRLHCINNIRIPGPSAELSDYFEFYPFVGPRLPKDYFNVICGMNATFEKGRDLFRITLRTLPNNDDFRLPFLLDLDYLAQEPSSIELVDLPGWLELAHTRMRDGFEGAITDRLRNTFNSGNEA